MISFPEPWVTKTGLDPETFEIHTRYSGLSDNETDGRNRARMLGFRAEGLRVKPGAIINLSARGSIGDGCLIGLYAYVNGDVVIEDLTLIGPYCSLTSNTHLFDAESRSFTRRNVGAPIRIGRGSWLASGVTVTAGVTVGKGNLLCANAVVTKDTEDYGIYGGTPARKLGHIDLATGDLVWDKRP
ncbi:MAG: acyltransferase [Spirochaetes bacterium]|nr:acyltransferase [Spirochaetota bacterium]